jgi:hypothetical protein
VKSANVEHRACLIEVITWNLECMTWVWARVVGCDHKHASPKSCGYENLFRCVNATQHERVDGARVFYGVLCWQAMRERRATTTACGELRRARVLWQQNTNQPTYL